MTVLKKINIFLILIVFLIFIYTFYRDLIYFNNEKNYASKNSIIEMLNKNKIKVIDTDDLVFRIEKDKFSLFPLRKMDIMTNWVMKKYQKQS